MLLQTIYDISDYIFIDDIRDYIFIDDLIVIDDI